MFWRLHPTVIVLGLASFLTDAASHMITPLLPIFLTQNLGTSRLFAGLVEACADTLDISLKIASGWFSDRIRHRKVFVLAGYSLTGLVRPVMGIAYAAWQVMGIRLLDRIGKGVRLPSRDALIADVSDPDIRGRSFGWQKWLDYLGGAVGPIVAIIAIGSGLGIQQIFLITIIPGALAILLVWRFVREKGPAQVTPASPLKSRPTLAFYIFVASVFIFTLGNSTDAFLILRAKEIGVSQMKDLLILWCIFNISRSLGSVPAGIASDRLGRRPVIVIGWGIYAISYAGFALIQGPGDLWWLFPTYGLFYACTEGVQRALIADLVPLDFRGRAYGIYYATIGIATIPATLILGTLWKALGGVAFLFGTACAILGILILLLTRIPKFDSSR